MPAFIEDGHYYPAFIKGVFGQYEDVWILFRPALPMDNSRAFPGGRKLEEQTPVTNIFLATRVQKWTITNSTGAVVPINPDNMNRINDKLHTRMTSIVQGYEAPDQTDLACPFEGYGPPLYTDGHAAISESVGNSAPA